MDLTFDFDSVTPRMLLDFKRETGESLFSLVEGGGVDLSALTEEAIAGFVWLALRMSGRPDATYDDALDTPFTSLNFADAGDAELDPTSASSEPS